MPLQDDDLLLVQRGTDLNKTTVQEIANHVKDGFTGSLTLDGVTLVFEGGLLISAT